MIFSDDISAMFFVARFVNFFVSFYPPHFKVCTRGVVLFSSFCSISQQHSGAILTVSYLIESSVESVSMCS